MFATILIVLVVVSLFLAAGLNPVVEFFMVRGLKRSWSVLCVIVLVLSALALFIAAIVPVSSAAIEKMLSVVSVVCCVQVAPSGEVIAKPKSPTATNSLPVQTRPSM